MSIPTIDHPSIEVTLPVYKLSGTPVVLLPGILYKISFNSKDAVHLLSYYKKNLKVNNLLISKLPIPWSFEQKGGQVSQESIEDSRLFRKFFNADLDDENAYDWLILGIIPQNGNKNLTISRIVGIVKDQKGGVTLTFQALTRGEILGDSEVQANDIKEKRLKVYSNALELGDLLNEKVEILTKKASNLFNSIDSFLSEFLLANSMDKSSSSQGKKYALTLSPLANVLNVQFSNDYKQSSIKLKKLIEKYVSTFDQYCNRRNTEKFLKILDLIIAILPTNDKLSFLSKTNVFERLDKFERIVQEFDELFKNLYKFVEYVDKFYSDATDLEKSKIISSQLKSIRFSLDSIKPNVSGPVFGPDSSDPDDQNNQNDDLQQISKFVFNLPFDVNEDEKKLLVKDFKRMKKIPQQHSEYQVLRTYFDVVMSIPFGRYFVLNNVDILKASQQLNNKHYGLYHVKKRLLQYLSVLKLHHKNNGVTSVPQAEDEKLVIGETSQKVMTKVSRSHLKIQSKSPILLFVGPPGVGKTSLAKSIAQALGRKFQRVSLGGIRDESEIRGHRRTYVGSLPGVIINALRKAGTMNPLILLDEIDKVCGGANSAGRINGDPEAALLEVLDPEQNWNFSDHYIGFSVDLSNVLFLCTANELSTISSPLRDRMEIIEISGYTFEEKIKIGEKHLLPKQIKLNGLPKDSIKLTPKIWNKIIQEYVREAGVRNLERKIASICRGKAVEYIEDESKFSPVVEVDKLVKYLGLPNYPISKSLLDSPKYAKPQGIVNGLSYSSDGSGCVLVFEIVAIPTPTTENTSPSLILTGRLGETLTESIKIGLTFIKSMISRNLLLNFNQKETLKRFNNSELHLHVPMGSIPKDGPSAGITITLALLSIVLNKPVDGRFAMTGEITLRGKVLPIGGLLEKLLGASQFGIKVVLVPKLNRKDIVGSFFNEDDTELIKLLCDESNNAPELKVKEKLGLEVIYVDTFFDVIKAVWEDVNIDECSANLISNHL